ncbi:pyocin knob domain-containing protein [Aquimarina pacifica]|uniref:pyocin knob domain-containing protein n=1 Tax=Aquimarina pacifica TaxID=1296415 RepID=UPI00047247F0|nr:pyocin knob domain-containing protein [Aquimarina pacifica]
MKNQLCFIIFFALVTNVLFSQTFSTNATPVGLEHNILFNATSHYTVTQTGTALLNLPRLFDGAFQPSYTATGPTIESPTVITIEGLPQVNRQRGAWVGWSTRYWETKNFKIEGYDDQYLDEWVTLADYSTTDYPSGSRDFNIKITQSGSYTKLRFTFYTARGTDGRLGISELFYIHPEATTPYANLGMGIWKQEGTEVSSSASVIKANTLLINDSNTTTDWNTLWQSGFYQGNNAANSPHTGWLWGINMNHTSNSETYKYNGQLAITNTSSSPKMYFRSTNRDGEGTWVKVVHDNGDQKINGGLTVAGEVYSQKVRVRIDAGADFVFENNYDLPKLEDVASFVKQHKHLPEIAPATLMEAEGLELAEMNIKLLQKIEELTLYTIQQEGKLNALEEKLKRMEALEIRLTKLEATPK